jgi:lipopolysaccharide biosynthesis regulator YciM
MIRAGEGFAMQARTQVVNAISGRLADIWSPRVTLYLTTHLRFLCVVIVSLVVSPALAQHGGGGSHPTPPPNPPAPIPRPMDSNFDRNQIELDSTGKPMRPNTVDDRCLLPPLNGTREPLVDVKSMQVSGAGRKEYAAACDALRDKKFDRAADYLRKAVQAEPLYSAAWVTLGQLLVAQQKVAEGRDACSHAVAASASYLAGYLCLADISGREQKWDEMLKFSSRAIDLDPADDAVAYGLNAAANLNLHQLPAAEKSALKAIDIDKTHNDPRIYFLLAQIYEAKGEPDNEAAQLRQYLKFASDPNDAAMVKAYLAELEKRAGR